MDDVKITGMKFPDEKGGISLTARSPAFAAFASECVKMFKEDGGVNYVEWRMMAGEPGFGIFTVCIQREGGETPAQQNGRLRKELQDKELQISEYQDGADYDHGKMDDFAREFFGDQEGKTWKAGFTLGKLLEMVRDKLQESSRLNGEMRDLLISVNQAYTLTFGGQRGSMEMMFKTIDKYLKEQQTENRIEEPQKKDNRCQTCGGSGLTPGWDKRNDERGCEKCAAGSESERCDSSNRCR